MSARAKLQDLLESHADRIIKRVEHMLGDVIDPENMTEEAASEECWTLCIDAAHELGLEGDNAIAAAKEACGRLGYSRP